MLAEVARILKPAGIFVSSTVCLGDSYWRFVKLAVPLGMLQGLMPDVFGLPALSYWKAVGILVMAKILFGSFEGMGSKKGSKKHNRTRLRNNCGSDFSKWKHYDAFWKEEGKKAFDGYIERRHIEKQ